MACSPRPMEYAEHKFVILKRENGRNGVACESPSSMEPLWPCGGGGYRIRSPRGPVAVEYLSGYPLTLRSKHGSDHRPIPHYIQ
jgi:hypothetical protein